MKGRVDAPDVFDQLWILRFQEVFLPDPPPSDQQDDRLLPNLQSLLIVMNFSLVEEVCIRIPNIRRLSIKYDNFSRECQQKSYYYLHNLINLHKLESLYCGFVQSPERDDSLQSLMSPGSLRKLSLSICGLLWDDLITCGFSLPHLEALKLYKGAAVMQPEWDCVEGAFPSLRILKIYDANLMKWSAEESDFPKLEKLHLQNLTMLEDIPSGVGDIQTLRYLDLYNGGNNEVLETTTFNLKRGRAKLKETESFTCKIFQHESLVLAYDGAALHATKASRSLITC